MVLYKYVYDYDYDYDVCSEVIWSNKTWQVWRNTASSALDAWAILWWLYSIIIYQCLHSAKKT